MNFETARDIETCWKSREILAVACELVEAGLRCLDENGEIFFGPDNISESFTADGAGITGSAVHMLRSAHIIADYFGTHAESGVFHGRRKSRRSSANGRKICLYTLSNRGIAEAFLKRNGAAREPLQQELAI